MRSERLLGVFRNLAIALFVVALASAPWLLAHGYPASSPTAGSIGSISPSCASVGAPVTITGQGFALNLSIVVGGVPAQVTAASAYRATFIVPAGVALGPTTVTTNPVGSIAFKVCDLQMPLAWGGEWDMTVTYLDSTTQSVVAKDETIDFIRTGEAFGVTNVAKLANCTGKVSDVHFDVDCAAQVNLDSCAIRADVQIAADRSGDALTGSGGASLTVTGSCGPLTSRGQALQITGNRVSLNQASSGPPTTLVQSFVPFGALIVRPVGGER